eukprot:862576-Pelagomonas_calceolata.AAC.5
MVAPVAAVPASVAAGPLSALLTFIRAVAAHLRRVTMGKVCHARALEIRLQEVCYAEALEIGI